MSRPTAPTNDTAALGAEPTVARPPLKGSDLWCTPRWLLDLVRAVADNGSIALDPCPGPRGWTAARTEIRIDEGRDGLAESWAEATAAVSLVGSGLVFVNPPYGPGHLPLWCPKIAAEAAVMAPKGREIVALLPATPSPAWFQHLAPRADAICFLAGRPKFVHPETLVEADGPGTKDAAVFYFGDRASAFARVFTGRGWLVRK